MTYPRVAGQSARMRRSHPGTAVWPTVARPSTWTVFSPEKGGSQAKRLPGDERRYAFARWWCGSARSPPLASQIAGSTERTEATLSSRAVCSGRQSALPGGLAGAIHVKDQPLPAGTIPQPAGLVLFAQRAREQVREKACAQRFDRFDRQRGEPAREGRAGGQAITLEERREGTSPGFGDRGERGTPFYQHRALQRATSLSKPGATRRMGA